MADIICGPTNNGCLFQVPSKCVIYDGPNTTNIGYITNMNLTDLLLLIDSKFSSQVPSNQLIFDNIASLRANTNVSVKEATVLGYYSKGDEGGGSFYWDSTSTEADNNGTIIKATSIATGRWKRLFEGSIVTPRWFGCRGDGVTDDSLRFQQTIDTFANDLVGGGIGVLIPAGTYLLKDITISRGIKIYANQVPKDNVIAHCPVVIKPAPNATYIFNFNNDSKNSSVENLYIDADWQNNPNLTAAIRFAGTFNRLEGNNINACAKHAVYSTAGGSYIVDNNIQGWFGPPPTFADINDFKGALHIEAMGDSYVLNNEIGAAEPYLAGQVPTPIDMLRDPINRRICALVAAVFMGNSVISGNIIENGDRAAVINGALYLYHTGNRYEMCGGGGLLLRGNIFYGSFIGERFTNNSLAQDGGFYDLEIETGSAGNISFISPVFEILTSPVIPTSNFKVKNNILNKGSYQIDLVTPQFDLSYSANGPINTTDPARQPIRQVAGQFDPDNPYFSTVTAGVQDPTQDVTGLARLRKGTSLTNGNLIGSLDFYDANQDTTAIIGGNPGKDLWFNLLENGHLYSFQNGDFYVQKNGICTFTVWSIDGAGNTVFRMLNNIDEFSIRQSPGGNVRIGNGDDITIGLAGNGNITFHSTGLTSLPVAPSSGVLSDVDVLGRNTTTFEMVRVPASEFAAASGNANYIQNQLAGAQLANFAISGVGRIDSALSIATGAFPAYALHVGTIPSTPGISAFFSDRIIIDDAVNANEAVTKSQLDTGLGATTIIDGTALATASIDQAYMNTNYSSLTIGYRIIFTNITDDTLNDYIITKTSASTWNKVVAPKLT